MKTPNPKGYPKQSPIHQLRYAIQSKSQGHWSWQPPRKRAPSKDRTQEDVLRDAAKLLEMLGRVN